MRPQEVMKSSPSSLFSLAAALLLAGCAFERHYLAIVPERNQVVRAMSGDRFLFDLEENLTTGYEWTATCDDADVDVTIRHVPGEATDGMVGVPGVAKVEIRMRRGYDGPSHVRFRYARSWEKESLKEFSVTFYKRTGDTAFWE